MAADVIIIGAGASGLMAACELLKGGMRVEVLDAHPYAGGRMHTLHNSGFVIPIEAGAEFIHGDKPVTIGLLKEFGINYHKIKGQIWQVQYENFKKENDFIENDNRLNKKLKELEDDISVEEFLNINFNDEKDLQLKKSIRGFVEGYDTADISR